MVQMNPEARIKQLKFLGIMMCFTSLSFIGLFLFEVIINDNKVSPEQVEVARLQIKKDLLTCVVNEGNNAKTVSEYSQAVGKCFDATN